MRVMTWNCRRATEKHSLWGYFREMGPDVAFLQEAGSIPHDLDHHYQIKVAIPRTRTGRGQRFKTVLMVKGTVSHSVALTSHRPWVRKQLEYFAGNILAFDVVLQDGSRLTAMSVYSPAWPVDKTTYEAAEATEVKLELSRELWVTDLVTEALRCNQHNRDGAWVVGGDFNSCETFDSWKGGPRGNREWLDRMEGLGFTECLRRHQGCITPTFRGPNAGEANCQIDHLFVSRPLAERLICCKTGSTGRIFGEALSDHLPVVADFAEPR